MISIEVAFDLIDNQVAALANEQVQLLDVVGRVLASDVTADVNSPPHDKSMMDGFAVRSADVATGLKKLEVIETIIAGGLPQQELQPGQSAQIMTGAPIPLGADAVVMVEQTESSEMDGKRWVTLRIDSILPEKNVLRLGVNFEKGQTVFAKGHIIRPTDIGLLAEVGACRVSVGARPRVAVLPTGNELVDCSELPQQGQIRNSNGPLLLAMSQGLGLETRDLGIGRDDATHLRSLIVDGLQSDLLLLSGGVSAGTMDLVPGILRELGVREVFHKVCVKPGKPIWFGIWEQDGKRCFVFGLPGNPVSSLVGFQLFVRAAIRKLRGGIIEDEQAVLGELTADHETRGNRPTYWPAKVVVDGVNRKFKPLIWRGSSDLFALGEADGLINFPADSSDHPAGEQVRFHPFS